MDVGLDSTWRYLNRMKATPLPIPEENVTAASVIIRRPIEEVFSFYRDFRNLPKFLGDVMDIEEIDPATSRWTIQGPLGIRTQLKIRVTEIRENELLRYATVTFTGLLKTEWEVHFSPTASGGETAVREVMRAPLGRLGSAALALIGKFPAQEVPANLHRLKELMETGRVTNTNYAVTGKFR